MLEPPLPLDGIKVLDFTRWAAGPYATMLLADAGAEVLKVEPIGGEDTRSQDPILETSSGSLSAYFVVLNRSKKSVCIDITEPRGQEAVRRLVRSVDVVVENFRPGVMDRCNIGRESLMSIRPDLIYCSISGYGHSASPRRDDPAFAPLAEAAAGVVAKPPRETDAPVRVAAPLGDLYPGALAVGGIAMALLRRERTGVGSHVDMAMYDALVSLNANSIALSAMTGIERILAPSPSYAAPFGLFTAKDGFICIAVLGDTVWTRFCDAIGRRDLTKDETLSSGGKRSIAMAGALGEIVRSWLGSRTCDEAVSILVAHGVPAGKVARAFDVLASEQTAARTLVWDIPSFAGITGKSIGSPIRIEPNGFAPVLPVPGPGEHTLVALRDLGDYGDAELDSLVRDRVIEQWP